MLRRVLATLGVVLVRFFAGIAVDEIYSRSPSPDGEVEVVVYEANCGATFSS